MSVLDVALPEALGRVTDSYAATGGTRAALALVLQVYDDPRNQQAIAGICALFAQAGLRLIGVEAADRAMAPTPGRTDLARLLATEQVSAGVLSLLNAGQVRVDVHGVDDLSLIPPSHQAMLAVSGAREVRDRGLAGIRAILLAAHQRHVPPAVTAARRARYELFGARQPLTTQAGALRDAAREAGVDLADFPQVRRFLDLSSGEEKVNLKRVTAERETFLRRVVERVTGWHRPAGRNRIDIDLAKAAPVLEFWLAETGQSAAAFEAALTGPNPESVLLACKEWYDGWLGADARAVARAEFWEKLMRFALLAGVPYFELRDFRRHVAATRDGERLKVGLDDEMEDLHRSIADRLGGDAAEVIAIEERLETLGKLLQLAVPPGHAAAEARRAGEVAEAAAELAGLAGTPLPPALEADLGALAGPTRAALDFLEFSQRRSRHMVERMLELLEERHEEQGAIVVGGFHSKAITAALEDHPDVSWCVVMPAVDVEAGWREHRKKF